MSDYSKMLEASRHAVIEAAEVCRHVQRTSDSVRSVLKDDSSPVTVADYAAQAVIAHLLEDALGAVHLVAEEDADDLRSRLEAGSPALPEAVLNAVRLAWPDATMDAMLDAIDRGNAEPKRDDLHNFWTLDPVDGTKGFLRGQQYAISLAWIEHDSPVIGALAAPTSPSIRATTRALSTHEAACICRSGATASGKPTATATRTPGPPMGTP